MNGRSEGDEVPSGYTGSMAIESPERQERSDLLNQLRIERDGHPALSRARLFVIVAAVLGVVAVGAWYALSHWAVPRVQTAVAREAGPSAGPASVLDATGYVTARRQATVSAKITGKVAEVRIEEGQRVREGEVLARLEDTDARAQLALAQAQQTAARAQLAELRAQLAQAERDYVRQVELARRQLVSEQSLDAALAQRDTLRARLGTAGEQVVVARESARLAQVQLDSTVIRAPFDGVIVAKAAQPGEIVSPMSAGGFTRTGIGTIVDMGSLEIQVEVNEAFINRVTPGQPVEATLNAYPEWKIPASVIAIIPAADRSKATVKVRIAVQTSDPRVVPDMGVRVAFLGAPSSSVPAGGVLVPAESVRGEGGAAEVFVYADGKVERRPVALGRAIGGQRQVLGGLRAGERVVVAPAASLAHGSRVKLADPR
jgi:RND family efflux transporter MFP subunit